MGENMDYNDPSNYKKAKLQDDNAVTPGSITPPSPKDTRAFGYSLPNDYNLKKIWHQLIADISRNPTCYHLKSAMQEVRPISLINNFLTVAFENDFPKEHYELISRHDNLILMKKALHRLNDAYNWEIVVKKNFNPTESQVLRRRLESNPEVMETVQANEFVQNVCSIFNGEIIDVRG